MKLLLMYGMDLLNPASFKRMMSLLNGKIMQPVQGVIKFQFH